MKVKASLNMISLMMSHHTYATPFVKLQVGQIKIGYDMYVDYDVMEGTLGDIHMFDLTNYPCITLDPRE